MTAIQEIIKYSILGTIESVNWSEDGVDFRRCTITDVIENYHGRAVVYEVSDNNSDDKIYLTPKTYSTRL